MAAPVTHTEEVVADVEEENEDSADEQVNQAILDQLKETAAQQGISPEALYKAVQDRLHATGNH